MTGLRAVQAAKLALEPSFHAAPSALAPSERDERIQELLRSLAISTAPSFPTGGGAEEEEEEPPPPPAHAAPPSSALYPAPATAAHAAPPSSAHPPAPATAAHAALPSSARPPAPATAALSSAHPPAPSASAHAAPLSIAPPPAAANAPPPGLRESVALDSSLDLFLYAESVAASEAAPHELSSLVARAERKRTARQGSAPARVQPQRARVPSVDEERPPPPRPPSLPRGGARREGGEAALSAEEERLRASLARLDGELEARRQASAGASAARRHTAPSTLGVAAKLRMATAAAACAGFDATPCKMHGLLPCALCASGSKPRRRAAKPPPPPAAPPRPLRPVDRPPRRTQSAGAARSYSQLGAMGARAEGSKPRAPALPPRMPAVPPPAAPPPPPADGALGEYVDEYYAQLCSEWAAELGGADLPPLRPALPPLSSPVDDATARIMAAPNAQALLFG
ncbi:hypothetical protein AB1Y20_021168 [Prymnesium parvum]|uniref:Uncharacterized protein n=1 Tax=Prymnesium parvum TaxID=97485 RepID=A0AB34JIT9_PRYPA